MPSSRDPEDDVVPGTKSSSESSPAKGGIVGLEIVGPNEVERAVRIFRRDGFVVVRDALDADQTAFLRRGVEQVANEILAADPDRSGNRGSHRYSFGGSSATRSMLHRPEWQMLVDVGTRAARHSVQRDRLIRGTADWLQGATASEAIDARVRSAERRRLGAWHQVVSGLG